MAVNPKDPRYAHLIGKHIMRPLPIQLPREQKLIPIIGDEHVDFEFGTGVLKVTPAHDKADFEIGTRHKLPVMDSHQPERHDERLAGEILAGLDRFKARESRRGNAHRTGRARRRKSLTRTTSVSASARMCRLNRV